MNIGDYLKTMSDLLGCKFEIFGKSISSQKVFAEDGVLAPLAKRAENLSMFVLNKPIGANYQKISGGLYGYKVTFDDSVPNSYRILCMLDVLIEIIHQSSSPKNIKLDELLYD
jgi:intracellular multiplication protein IcmS